MFDFACSRLRHGRVALIGDAAVTARPHVGMGVSKAADDATTLAAALAAGDQAAALQRWDADRARYGRAVLQWGRALGSYIGPQPDDPEHRARATYHMRPDVLLSQTAASVPQEFLGA